MSTPETRASKCLYPPCNRKTYSGYCYQHKNVQDREQGHIDASPMFLNTLVRPPSTSTDHEWNALTTSSVQEAAENAMGMARLVFPRHIDKLPLSFSGLEQARKYAVASAVVSLAFQEFPQAVANSKRFSMPLDSFGEELENKFIHTLQAGHTLMHPEEFAALIEEVDPVSTSRDPGRWWPHQCYQLLTTQLVRAEWEIAQHMNAEGKKHPARPGLPEEYLHSDYASFFDAFNEYQERSVSTEFNAMWSKDNFANLVHTVTGQTPDIVPTTTPAAERQRIQDAYVAKQRLAQQMEENTQRLEEMAQDATDPSHGARDNSIQLGDTGNLPHNTMSPPESPKDALAMMAEHWIAKEQEKQKRREEMVTVRGFFGGILKAVASSEMFSEEAAAQRSAARERERQVREEQRRIAQEQERRDRAEQEAIERAAAAKKGMTLDEFRQYKAQQRALQELRLKQSAASIERAHASTDEYSSRAKLNRSRMRKNMGLPW